jgi:hypothetical protein
MKMCICGREIDGPGTMCNACVAKEDVQELRDLAQWFTKSDTQEAAVVPTDEQVVEVDDCDRRYSSDARCSPLSSPCALCEPRTRWTPSVRGTMTRRRGHRMRRSNYGTETEP